MRFKLICTSLQTCNLLNYSDLLLHCEAQPDKHRTFEHLQLDYPPGPILLRTATD